MHQVSTAYFRVKHNGLAAHLSNTQTTPLKARFNNIWAETQRTLRAMESDWWAKKSREIQLHADTNHSHAFHEAIRSTYGPQRRTTTPVRPADGSILYKDKQQILDRWAEHFNTLETWKAIAGLKNNKSPNLDGSRQRL